MSFLDDYGTYDDGSGYFDPNDPFGVQQYMTPQFPGAQSTAKWNFGAQLPNDIVTMGKQGNAIQDYYQILSNPVTQWLNMATTGQGAFDLNSLIGDQQSDQVTQLQNSDDEYLQAIGQQLSQGVPAAAIKTQLLTEPDIANDDRKLAIYNSAIDDAAKAQATQKDSGPIAQFKKLGLTNPLEQYTADNLPGDQRADPNYLAYLDRVNGAQDGDVMDQQWKDYGTGQNALVGFLRSSLAATDKQSKRPTAPTGPTTPTGRPVQQNQASDYYWGANVPVNNDQRQVVRQAQQSQGNGPMQRLVRQVGRNARSGAAAQAERNVQLARRARQINQETNGRPGESARWQNDIRAWDLNRQGRTPAGDQAAAMMNWLRSQGYGG